MIDAIEQQGSPLRGGLATIMPSHMRTRRPRSSSAAPLRHDAIDAEPETVSGRPISRNGANVGAALDLHHDEISDISDRASSTAPSATAHR